MSMRFHVLASGSSGNASVLEVGDFRLLIDFGLPVRALTQRLRRCGLSWQHIHAVLLSHPHSDHWQASTLTQLARLGLPLYCHSEHIRILDRDSRAFTTLSAAGLIRFYEAGQSWNLHPDCSCLPLSLQHDGAMTCGFRFEGPRTIFGTAWAVGYAADLGSWSPELARQFADVDILALEFNHDVAMQVNSGRHPFLIRRVLSDLGHLSNNQAAELFAEMLKYSEPGRLQSLVQLHLSQQCNLPHLARAAAQQVLDRFGIETVIHTTEQEQTGPTIRLGVKLATTVRRRPARKEPAFIQPLLPYAEEAIER